VPADGGDRRAEDAVERVEYRRGAGALQADAVRAGGVTSVPCLASRAAVVRHQHDPGPGRETIEVPSDRVGDVDVAGRRVGGQATASEHGDDPRVADDLAKRLQIVQRRGRVQVR
jgi:hypothetical protein